MLSRPRRGKCLVKNLLKSPDAGARESLNRGVRNAVNESKKAVNGCVRVDGGILIEHIMKEGSLHESLVLHVTAVASMFSLA